MSFRSDVLTLLRSLMDSSMQIQLKQIWVRTEMNTLKQTVAEVKGLVMALSPVAESAVEAMSYTGRPTWKYSLPGSTEENQRTSGVTADIARVNAAGALIFENVFISADPEDRPTEKLVLAVHKGQWVDVWEEER